MTAPLDLEPGGGEGAIVGSISFVIKADGEMAAAIERGAFDQACRDRLAAELGMTYHDIKF
jgi:hypothetical protein